MANNNNSQQNIEQGLNVADLFFYLLSKWRWILLSTVVCVALAWYHYATSPEIYFSSATVIIKDPSNKTFTAGLDRFDNYINKVNVANEILQFRSRGLMAEVVDRLHLDIDYDVKSGLRERELYTSSPLRLTITGALPESHFSFEAEMVDSTTVALTEIHGLTAKAAKITAPVGRPFILGGDTLTLSPTTHFSPRWFDEKIKITKLPVSAAVDYFLGNLGIRQEEDESSILTISIRDTSPSRARDVINSLVAIYNEEAIKDKNQVAVNTADFINERLIIIENELGNVESDLESYKQNNRIVSIGTTALRFEGDVERFTNEAIERETQLKWAEYVRDYLDDPSKSRELLPTNTGLEGSNVDEYINKYNQVKLKRDRLAGESGEANPVIEEMDQTLHSLKQSVVRSVDNMIVNLNVRRNDALSRQAQSQARTASIPSKERALLSIERQQKIKESLYMFLLNKREENALSQAMADNNARMVDYAHGPRNPIAPKRNRTLLLGFLLGLALPCTFFLMKLFLDTKVHSRKDVEGKISVPFLGEIPLDKHQRQKAAKGEENVYVNDIVAEAFRILRTNMGFMSKNGQRIQVITFTSFNEGAGKTFISRNLAVSLAHAGKKVVIVDLDIRKGTLSRNFGVKGAGVTNFIADHSVTLDEIITHKDQFDVVGAGVIAPNPAELLMSDRLDKLFEELRSRYDYIIADNVPVGIIADATIANRITDLTIFVARIGRLDRRQLPDIEQLYRENKLHNMAMMLNGAEVSHRYGYYGYYGYGYGYSYGDKKRKRGKKHQDE